MFDEFFGVQMHPIAVHAPVVLVPIFAVVSLVLLVRSDWRDRSGWWMLGAIVLSAVMLFVAKESGEAAREAGNVFGDVSRHSDLGEQTFILSLVWIVVFGAVVGRDRMVRRSSPADLGAAAVVRRDPVVLAASALAAIAAVVVTIWLVRTGHAGAESRWG